MVVSLLTDELASYFASIYKNNMPVIHVYQFLESIILILFFKRVINSKFLIISGSVLLLYLLLNPILISSWYEFDYLSFIIKSFFFMICCIAYFFEQYKKEKLIFLDRDRDFWFVCGFLFYFSGAFFTFLTYDLLKTWILHNLSNAAKNVILMIGFLIAKKH